MVVQDSMDPGDPRRGVLLEPFIHQVGGHMSMMKYDEHTVCKPLVSQEQRFYESLPSAMKQFTPQYKGTISVHLQKDSRGHLSLIANPLKENRGPYDAVSPDPAVSIWQKLKQTTSSSTDHALVQWNHGQLKHTIQDSCPSKALLRTEFHFRADVASFREDANGNQAEKKSFNPWGLHCHRVHLTRMYSEYQENKLHRFLLLENVVSKYKYPCILDLKMGTRQHGDDASEEKKARHIKKCEQSTSASLGVRICGMQVYQADTQHFLCKDKYYGRKLSVDGFRQALYQFLHNGTCLQTAFLQPILSQLEELLSVIKTQSSYRFYSSSLLIIYEGQDPPERTPRSCLPKTNCTSPRAPRQVDVRMIDFAHTTFKGSQCTKTAYDGPDPGYIFGLENLIRILRDIAEGK
ncbi:inositol hexakisphosphate kinase 3 isoform X1 [Ornithorhynchus anatinus]|uniref:Kinase n=2 Tax=Ornithorhynchus anatinus TaxID=9258 RepID=F7DPM0_ORNAN|nr:inositol hexakisphosphate kinase 3 isoform X1 [Ornithorhynchus anatinus]XP_028925734.1 inositol hexakisphosphate kinase 3 isoform X1 [Ornithorhynchus anatinus]XP_028925735.1 inositol hexakisphosphate kinase 3 isoform X1 [Ornithorhynchus anatinus]